MKHLQSHSRDVYIFLDDQVFTRLDSQYSLLAPRGKILDRNDHILALDIKGYSVGIDLSKFIYDKDIILFLSEQFYLMKLITMLK